MKRRNRTIFSRYQAPDRRVVEAADYSIGELGGVSDADWGDLGHNLVQGPTDPREVDAWEDERDNGLQRFIDGLPDNEKMVLPEAWLDHHASHRTAVDNDDERDADEEAWQSKNDDTSDADADAVSDSQMADSDFAQKYQYDKDDDSKKESSRLVELSRREASLLQAMPHATLNEARQIMAELNDIKIERNAIHQASRDLDLANAVVADHLTPVISTMSRSSAASDWLAEIETPGLSTTASLRAEADLWWGRTHSDVKADATELVTQALGYSRLLTSGLADPEGAQRVFMARIVTLAEGQPAAEPTEDGAAESSLPVAVNPSDAPETFDHDTLSATSRRAAPPIVRERIQRQAGLNDQMEFDHVIQVHEDGSVTDAPGMYAPDLHDGEIGDSRWEFFTTGYSGQDRYSGPIMHSSEYIGGQLERDILATPGFYVAVVDYPSDDGEPDGWAVLRYNTDIARLDPAWASRHEALGGNPHAVGTPNWFDYEQQPTKDPDPEKTKLFPNGIPLKGDLTPEQQAWMNKRSFHTAGAHDYCPRCGASGSTMQSSGTQKCDSCGLEHLQYQRTDKKTSARRVAAAIDDLRQVVESKSMGKVKGQQVDTFTASAIVGIFDQLGPDAQAKYAQIIESDLLKAASIAFKLAQGAPKTAGIGDWPKVPSTNFPGEMTSSCPRCGSTHVILTGNNLGSDVVRGNFYSIVRCGDCGFQEVGPGKAPTQLNHLGEEVDFRGIPIKSKSSRRTAADDDSKFPWASASDEEKCAQFRKLDGKFNTSENSPLHHDNRCPIHGREAKTSQRRTAADEPSDTGAAESSLPVAVNPTDAPEGLDQLLEEPNTGPGPIDGGTFTPSGAADTRGSSPQDLVANAQKLAAFRARVRS